MNNKVMSIIFGDLDKENRHYVMKRMVNPDKDYKGPTMSNAEKEEIRKKEEERSRRAMKREARRKAKVRR